MRILVVEDDATLRLSLAEQLRARGFAVDLAADGPEGEYGGIEYPLDVAVVDLGLPGKSGLESPARIFERAAASACEPEAQAA